mmetsp:Transcript_24494/g.48004  ORF Transcript_24494/g.48004 Transcript_24494/m.48004 type:complete len:512 (+) Transcript_24494:322-1857(+)
MTENRFESLQYRRVLYRGGYFVRLPVSHLPHRRPHHLPRSGLRETVNKNHILDSQRSHGTDGVPHSVNHLLRNRRPRFLCHPFLQDNQRYRQLTLQRVLDPYHRHLSNRWMSSDGLFQMSTGKPMTCHIQDVIRPPCHKEIPICIYIPHIPCMEKSGVFRQISSPQPFIPLIVVNPNKRPWGHRKSHHHIPGLPHFLGTPVFLHHAQVPTRHRLGRRAQFDAQSFPWHAPAICREIFRKPDIESRVRPLPLQRQTHCHPAFVVNLRQTHTRRNHGPARLRHPVVIYHVDTQLLRKELECCRVASFPCHEEVFEVSLHPVYVGCQQGPLWVCFPNRPQSCGGCEHASDLVVCNNPPVGRRVWSPDRFPLKEDRGCSREKRTVQHKRVPDRPPDVRCRHDRLARMDIKHVLHAPQHGHGMPRIVPQHPLRLSGGTAGVEHVQRVAGRDRDTVNASPRTLIDHLLPQDVSPGFKGALHLGALQENNLLRLVRREAEGVVQQRLVGDDASGFDAA